MTLKIIVGLGNPGDRYRDTRHNIGFETVDSLAKKWGFTFKDSKFKAMIAEGKRGADKIILVKPLTYMNLSGQAVSLIYNFYKAEEQDLLIIFDDVDIHLGSIRLKSKGSAGSHNGVKSLVKELATENFPRLKLSIGRRPAHMDMADFVLGKFSDKELLTIREEVEAAVLATEDFLDQGIDFAMNKWNSWLAPSIKEMTEEDKKEEAKADQLRQEQDDFRKNAKWCGM